jgi:hypothetical protein
MKLITICDSDGKIVALMTAPADGPRPSMPGFPLGHQEIEIDVPGITEATDDEELHRRLNELATGHRVDVQRKAFLAR